MKRKIALRLNTKPLSEKLNQLIYHLEEAQKLIDSINSMKAKDLIVHPSKNQQQ